MNEHGKIIAISAVKGGVGKTTLTLNLAGLYYLMGKKVLVIDLDLYAGGIATCLDLNCKKDMYSLVESIRNNRFTSLHEYVTQYNSGIDVLAAPRDPRYAFKIESKYIAKILSLAKLEYDIILADMHHILDEINLVTLDLSYMSAYIITNDLVDLKNMRSLLSIFTETEKKNYKLVLNNSRDTGREYISMFDMRNLLKNNIDYTISNNFYIKNIDKYVLNGEILTLNKTINKHHSKDIKNLKKLALSLINEDEEDVK